MKTPAFFSRDLLPRGLLACTLLSGVQVPSARAHQFWLSPSSYVGAVGRPVTVDALAGTGFRGERKPWSPTHAIRFVARTARIIDLTQAASAGDMTWARFVPTNDGGAWIAFESTFTPIQLAAGPFDVYLQDEGLTAARNARARGIPGTPGRERYRRCAKAWLSGRDVARATFPIGMPLEIVPGAAPGSGPVLAITVLREGHPLAGALVKAWRAPLDSSGRPADPAGRDSVRIAWQAQTDARGRVSVPAREPGEWLVSVVDMVPCRGDRGADWESTWASLTFIRGSR